MSENPWPVDSPVDLVGCTFDQLVYFCAGVLHGAQTQAATDDEREMGRQRALHARAVATVRAIAEIPERDSDADAERGRQRAEWWAERRGERRSA